jgi:nuclear GTP-binding protein
LSYIYDFIRTTVTSENTIQASLPKANSTRCYYRNLKHILEKADVIVEVLDARCPNDCRHFKTEEEVIEKGKKLIFLLNKIDLVPRLGLDRYTYALVNSYHNYIACFFFY